MLAKITTKHGSNGLVRFVTHKRFAVLLRQLSVNSLSSCEMFVTTSCRGMMAENRRCESSRVTSPLAELVRKSKQIISSFT